LKLYKSQKLTRDVRRNNKVFTTTLDFSNFLTSTNTVEANRQENLENESLPPNESTFEEQLELDFKILDKKIIIRGCRLFKSTRVLR